jgi:hypothetical protein
MLKILVNMSTNDNLPIKLITEEGGDGRVQIIDYEVSLFGIDFVSFMAIYNRTSLKECISTQSQISLKSLVLKKRRISLRSLVLKRRRSNDNF